MNAATTATTAIQYVLVDEREYAFEQHGGPLYWCGTAWSTDLDRAIVYRSLEAAEQQKQLWIKRSEETWSNLFRPNPPPAGSKPAPCAGHTATVHNKVAILAKGRIFYAAFGGALDAALAAEFDKAAARDIGRAAGNAAIAAAFPNGTRVA